MSRLVPKLYNTKLYSEHPEEGLAKFTLEPSQVGMVT